MHAQLYENGADGFLPCCAANGQTGGDNSIARYGEKRARERMGWTGKGRVTKDGGECNVFVKASFPFVG